ncbi:flagellar biosynthesis anti-sigma factor FlgM [Oceanobacillus luteolus]|uniref:Negative regulator of flagellin synthesis n=1 Tax=Oceanobacillus luteolus TaxID=1274358 RepID=A0ABW4HPP2_9BACI|nr:flagellar biosynthesis anti-sigma factor FlgM [Oceanobacillus luteolus]MCM3740230.1 flagellar biosynthesis anti-sigma factor FlgM [Oceanobacillus luteolus]
MKINGPNHLNLNPYRQQMQKQMDVKKAENRSDELQISKEAFKLQGKDKPHEKRAAVVQEIKQQIATGEYKVDVEKTAQKMMDFWSK